MATFSWADTARAVFGPCLPCLPSSRSNDSGDAHATRRDELESLLQGAEFTDTETDADALSLHSHIGQRDGRKGIRRKRTKNKASIRLFGYDLFGRPLPDPETEAEEEREARRRVSRISSSTLDSDAAPLADDAIAELSAQTAKQRAQDEARKARKQLRKQQKAAALLDTHGNTFEGFPGSGALSPAANDFGPFQQGPKASPGAESEFVHVRSGGADEADAEADFDAGSYLKNAAPRSDSGSGTRSRTSASSSHPHLIPLPPSSSSSHTSFTPTSAPKVPSKPKRSKKAKSGTRSSGTVSSTTASQPRSPTSVAPAPHVEIAGFSHGAEFEGVPQGDDFLATPPRKRGPSEPVYDEQQPFSTPRLSQYPSHNLEISSGFPSTGLARSDGFPTPHLGGRKNSLSMGRQGAFLARTGDDA